MVVGGGDGQYQNDGMGGIEPGTGSAVVIEVFIVVVVYNCRIPAASVEQSLPGHAIRHALRSFHHSSPSLSFG